MWIYKDTPSRGSKMEVRLAEKKEEKGYAGRIF